MAVVTIAVMAYKAIYDVDKDENKYGECAEPQTIFDPAYNKVNKHLAS